MAVLIQNPPVPRDNAPASFGLRLQQFHFGYCMDRIAEDDGTMKFPFEDRHECQGVDRGAWLISPVAMARPRRPCATGRPKGLLRAEEWSTCSGLKSPDRPAKSTTSVSVTVRRGLSHSSPTTRSSNEQIDHGWRVTAFRLLRSRYIYSSEVNLNCPSRRGKPALDAHSAPTEKPSRSFDGADNHCFEYE